MSSTPKRRTQNIITSVLLLALLVLNLAHSHFHLGNIGRFAALDPNTSVSASKEAREGPDDKRLPCLACACQKQSLVIFFLLTLLFAPPPLGLRVLEVQPVFISQLVPSPVLSRAPPFLR